MFLTNEKYEITVVEAPHYSINSTDNKKYDMCINVLEDGGNVHYSSYEMEVVPYGSAEKFSMILIGSYCTKVLQNSGILEDDILLLILDDKILKINLCDFSYTKYHVCKPFGTYYEIYKCQIGFLVFGELEIILLDINLNECWRYATQHILFGAECLQIQDEYICFRDYEGNYHEVDWSGNQRRFESRAKNVITIHMNTVKTPKEFQQEIRKSLSMPSYYGLNWDAFWDGISGLIKMPDELILEGWHIYKSIQKEDAEKFEGIMKKYNSLECYKKCECIYKYYV